MKPTKYLLASGLTALALVAAIAFGIQGFIIEQSPSVDGPYSNLFPNRLDSRLQLKEGEMRRVDYYPDGNTPRQAVIDHANGNRTNQWYREDGTIKEVRTEAPGSNGGWKTIRHGVLADDGVTYISDIDFYQDGSVRKDLQLVNDTTTEGRYFHEKGELQKRLKIEKRNSQWVTTEEDVFRMDGSLEARTRVDKDGARLSEQISQAGITLSTTTVNRWHSDLTEKQYYQDGTTLKRLVQQDSSKTVVKDYREDGTELMEFQHLGAIGKSTLWIDHFSAAGKKLYNQWWDLRDGEYVLWRVVIYKSNGDVAREVVFHKDGKTILSEVIPLTSKGTSSERFIRVYREDGTLEKVRHIGEKGIEISEELFEVEANIKAELSLTLKQMPELNNPPQTIEYVPDQGP